MRAVVTGATGLVGRRLLSQLPQGVALSRDPERAKRELGVREAYAWSPEREPAPSPALRGARVVFHLAGEPVAEGRWTEEKKARIRDSRVLGTRNLVQSLAAMEVPPPVLVSASAVGYYGDRGETQLDETTPCGEGFLADVCRLWEQEALAAERLGIRVVCVRIGIVLAAGGGALQRMLTPFKLGAGGRLGSGRQWMPWIHIDDLVGLLLHAARAEVRGAMNGVAPEPVTNAEFTQTLARILHRPALLPIPKTTLRIAFGELSQVMLASQRVIPRVAQQTGYAFAQQCLVSALKLAVENRGAG